MKAASWNLAVLAAVVAKTAHSRTVRAGDAGPVTIGGYWFNPGSSSQVFIGMVGATF
jgi:hypothetical protein